MRRSLLALLVLCAATARAQTVNVTHTGYVLQSNDAPFTGSPLMQFALYDAETGGAQVWQSASCNVPIIAGYYAVTLGDGCFDTPALAAAAFGATRWLEVSIAGSTLAPRTRLSPPPASVSFTGSLAGDVTGTQDATSVVKLRGHAVSAAAPANGNLLRWDGAAWAPYDGATGFIANGTSVQAGSFNVSGTGTVAKLAVGAGTPTGTGDLRLGGATAWGLETSESPVFQLFDRANNQRRAVFDTSGNAWIGGTITNVAGANASLAVNANGNVAVRGTISGDGSGLSSVPVAGRPVSTTTPIDGQLLRYNGTASRWEATTVTTGGAVAAASAPTCDATTPGAMYFNTVDKSFYGCNGTSWQSLTNTAAPGTTQASAAASCRAVQLATPSATTGAYWLDPNGGSTSDAFTVTCDMTTSGGGWTPLVSAVASALDSTTPKQYLYTYSGTWYRSPVTTQPWSWSTGFELTGTYHWFNGTYAQVSCNGSSEKPVVGIGCSTGAGNTRKVIPSSAGTPASGSLGICQDTPNIFGSVCATANVFVREVRGCGTSTADPAPSCEAIRTSTICTAKGDGSYFLNPGNGTVQVWCDMTTDGGGWALVHKTNMGNSNDRNDAGTNVAALANAAIDTVAALPRNTMNLLGGTVRVLDSTGAKRMYYTGAPYYLTDSHPFQYYAPQGKISYAASYGATSTSNITYNVNHSACIVPAGSEHICPQRWCCGSPNAGLWMNGGTWAGNYYAGTAWVR